MFAGVKITVVVVAFVAVLAIAGRMPSVLGHTYHTGSCPSVEPMAGFEMRQFLGIWYAVQKTSTASTCLIYNITQGEEPGEYTIEQTSQHFAIGLTPIKHEYKYTGKLAIPDPSVPGKMIVSFPLSVAGDSSFTVFMSDYTQYAGLFSCQKVTFAHRQSATLLSRTRSLDKIYLDKLRSRLASYSIDPFDLSIINQTGCPKVAGDGYVIDINPDTFSASNIGSVFRKAGEKIGDGVEWTIDAGKKVYHRLADSTEEPKDPLLPAASKSSRTLSMDDNAADAEWVRF